MPLQPILSRVVSSAGSVRAIMGMSLVSVSLAFLVSCVTTGPGGKKSFLMFGSAQEVEFGRGIDEQVRAESKILDDPLWQNYVNDLGQKLVAHCDRKDINYTFSVVESDQINAFALPGGYIYFYTGLLKVMDDEAELAAVMSHEISHVVARHGMKRLQTALIAEMGYSVIFGGADDSRVREAAVGIGLSLVFAGYSRSAEREADNYGIGYMTSAGYDPGGAIRMFEHLSSAGENSPSSYEKLVASHPQTQERIRLAKKQIVSLGDLPIGLRRGAEKYQKMKLRLP